MIDPKKILTENKERDANILNLYWLEKKTQTEIANELGIAQTTVSYILYQNRTLVKYDPEYEKAKRIRHYKKQYGNSTPEQHSQEHWLDKIKDEVESGNAEQVQEAPTLNRLLGLSGTQN